MYYRFFRPVLVAIILGTVIVLAPLFVLKVIAFFLITGLLIRFFIFRKIRRFFKGQLFYTRFADDIRNMSDAEYKKYKQRYTYNGFTDYYGEPQGQTIEIEVK